MRTGEPVLGPTAEALAAQVVAPPDQIEHLLRSAGWAITGNLAGSVLATLGWVSENCEHDRSSLHFWLDLLNTLGKDVLNLAIATHFVATDHLNDPGEIERGLQTIAPRVVDELALTVDLRSHLQRGRGQTGDQELPRLTAVATHKLLAAAFLSVGMPDILRRVAPIIDAITASGAKPLDYKSPLQEYAQSLRPRATIDYALVSKAGPEHDTLFRTRATIRSRTPRAGLQGRHAIGAGPNKKASEQDAACRLLKSLTGKSPSHHHDLRAASTDFDSHSIPPSHARLLPDAETALGHQFASRRLLSAALVHPSYLNEAGGGVISNRPLASLGARVLPVALRQLVVRNPDPWLARTVDTHTRVAGYVLSEPCLAGIARSLRLRSMLATGGGDFHRGDAVDASTLQACMAAAYLDLGLRIDASAFASLHPMQMLCDRQLSSSGLDAMIAVDPKTILQEVAQALGIRCSYSIVSETGPKHSAAFVAGVRVSGGGLHFRFVGGPTPSKATAEKDAAVLPLRIVSAFAHGIEALEGLLNLDSAPSAGFVRLLIEQLMTFVGQRPAGWRALRQLDLFGARALLEGSRSEARTALGHVWDVVWKVCPERLDDLATVITQNVRRPDADLRKELENLARRLADLIEMHQLESSPPIQTSGDFTSLLLASSLGSVRFSVSQAAW